ncbi:DNA polymerase III subunit chi [Pseudidiomarina sp.]|uniref:DNA polymerase III subunit chi n=1 Tax=Pseudidiomarina sp. TaxID=2081707 RepID=UPI003A97E75C
MAQGIFYVLDGLNDQQQLQFFCERIASAWREYRSVRVWCADQATAEQLDEALWQAPGDAFVPHNLVGEGPAQGAPVELCWPQANVPKRRTAAVVNLMSEIPDWQGARMIIERVPSDENARQQARERYKTYRGQHVELQTIKASEQMNSSTK